MRRRSWALMIASGLMIGFPLAGRAQTGRGAARPAQSTAMELAEGKKVFDSQCAWCHGNEGDGGTGPNLHGKLPDMLELDDAVERMVRAIEKKQPFCAFPRSTVWRLRMLRLLPRSWQDAVIARMLKQMPS